MPAAELGFSIHPRGLAYLLPVIGGFVGGDTVAGVLATGLCDAAGPSLLVDIGTNGEIVLSADGKLTAASTAAGPAFEGARISQGMRGSTGAIEKVVVNNHLRINVIGDVPPLGICGSALIDLAAELLRHGLLSPEGRLRTPDQLPSGVLPDLAQRLVWQEKQTAFLVAAETETGHGRPIWLTQRDLRELQLATGAIRAGIVVLLKHAGLAAGRPARVLVARRVRQLHSPQQCPTDRTVAARRAASPHSLSRQHLARRRQLVGAFAAGAADGGRTGRADAARRPLARSRLRDDLCRIDDLPGRRRRGVKDD